MSPPKHYPSGTGTGTGSGQTPPEKSRFAQTCNRLSLFLKEKGGNIRDLNFSINAKFDATGVSVTPPAVAKGGTVDLLSNIGEKAEKPTEKLADDAGLPKYVILESFCERTPGEPDKKPKTRTGQMTIFYEGQVVVLDDVPAERARDLILIAKNGKSDNRVELGSGSKGLVDVSGSKEGVSNKAEKDSDLPIARRASLHKFLAKRKDRASVRAPYQANNNQFSPGGSSSGNERSFDLNM